MTVVELDTRRREKIGGSEAAAACGVDPYRSRVMLWAEKTGRLERPDTEAMHFGRLLEPVVFAELERRGFELMPAPADEWTHSDAYFMVCHPDGFVALEGERGLLEIKTAGHFAGHDWSSDAGAPLAYQVQAHHNMEVTGCDVCLLACLVAGQRLELRTVRRDREVIAAMVELEAEFREYLIADTPPPPDGSSSAHDAIRAMYPESSGKTVRLDRATWDAVLELRARKDQLATVKAQVAELQQRIELAMGDAELAVSPFDTPAAKWPTIQQTRLDTTALKAARPEVYAEFAATRPIRRFTLE